MVTDAVRPAPACGFPIPQVADSRPINNENRTTQLTDPTANALKGNLVMIPVDCIPHAVPDRSEKAKILAAGPAETVALAPRCPAGVPDFHHALTFLSDRATPSLPDGRGGTTGIAAFFAYGSPIPT